MPKNRDQEGSPTRAAGGRAGRAGATENIGRANYEFGAEVGATGAAGEAAGERQAAWPGAGGRPGRDGRA